MAHILMFMPTVMSCLLMHTCICSSIKTHWDRTFNCRRILSHWNQLKFHMRYQQDQDSTCAANQCGGHHCKGSVEPKQWLGRRWPIPSGSNDPCGTQPCPPESTHLARWAWQRLPPSPHGSQRCRYRCPRPCSWLS